MKNKDIKSFFESIKPIRAAYKNVNFNYLAVKHEGNFQLIQGRLFLNTGTLIDIPEPYKSENIIVGRVLLPKTAKNIEDFIEKLLSGSFNVDDKKIIFTNPDAGQYNFYHNPFHQEGLQNQNRLNVLTIKGSHPQQFLKQPALDWEVMAAAVPFGGLQEVAYEYGLGVINQDSVTVEIIAPQVAAISGESTIKDNKANIVVNIAKHLPTKLASVGYNIHQNSKVLRRGSIDLSSLKWKSEENYKNVVAKLEIPQGSLLHCFAVYAGIAQHHYWILDPSKISNPRQAAQEAFDENLEFLKKAIEGTNSKQRSHQFEAAVACLLWMLGFAVSPIDNVSSAQEVADIIATTPKGNYAVVECTTGLLKEDNKLPKLHDRALAVRKKLQSTGNHMFQVLPVLVTQKTREEIKPELEQAEKHGILVMTREDLNAAIKQLYIYPNPDKLYDEAMQTVRATETKYQEKNLLSFTNAASLV